MHAGLAFVVLLGAFYPIERTASAAHGEGNLQSQAQSPPAVNTPMTVAGKARVDAAYGKLLLSFEANYGQTDPEVKFLSRAQGYTVFLTSTDAVFALDDATVRMRFPGANSNPKVVGLDAMPGRSHYFLGDDPAEWQIGVPHFGTVSYKDVYSGIDVVYYGNRGQLEYDFVLARGADPATIALAFDGTRTVDIDENGNLVLTTATGEVWQKKPGIYQDVNGQRVPVEGQYTRKLNGQIGFRVAAYDTTRTLVIDPAISYFTYLGGSDGDQGNSIAVDASGNTYVAGVTRSTNFPTASPEQPAIGGAGTSDGFVTKLNSTGTGLVYSTYLGGTSFDLADGIAADGSGNAYVTGFTSSFNFPTTPGAFQTSNNGSEDVFVTKLDAGGVLVYSSYLGGSGVDRGRDIAVDATGSAYVTGSTASTNFDTTPGAFDTDCGDGDPANCFFSNDDAFVTKFNAAGSGLVYSTYLGGAGRENFFFPGGIAVDGSGNAYITGSTDSVDFPTRPFDDPVTVPIEAPFQDLFAGGNDAYVTKLNVDGTDLIYSTYLGGGLTDLGTSIAVDTAGSAYITGRTFSTDFPMASPFQGAIGGGNNDVFVSKFDASGTALVYSTYLGGGGFGGSEIGKDIAVNSSGNAYVTGVTDSLTFPTEDPIQASKLGNRDAFVTKFSADGTSLLYSTYLGGTSLENSFNSSDGDIAVDTVGNAYVTGSTQSSGLATPGAFQTVFAGNGSIVPGDAFVTKIVDQALSCPACDLTGDNLVDFDDLALIFPCMGQTAPLSPPCAIADVNGDGTVNFNDVSLVVSNFT